MRRAIICTASRSALVLLSFALVACGSSGSPSAHSTGAPGQPSAHTTTSTSPTAAAAVSVPAASSDEIAARLLDRAGYAAALGGPVSAVEDDGTFPGAYGGTTSVARLATGSGLVFTVSLDAVASSAIAHQLFTAAAQSATSIPHVGDEAASANGTVTVRKGAQVLTVAEATSARAEKRIDNVKSNGGDPTALITALQRKALTLAPVLAAHTTGQAASRSAFLLPPGAIDPCGPAVAAAVQKTFGKPPSSMNYATETPPTLACEITAPGTSQPIEVTTLTDAQLAASINPESAPDAFHGDETGTSDASTAANEFASPGAEYNEVLHHDPFGWILGINFPGLTRQCIDPNFQAKGKELIEQLMRAMGPDNLSSDEYFKEKDEDEQLAEDYPELAARIQARAETLRLLCR